MARMPGYKRPKKTISVAFILADVNGMLQHSTCTADVRSGMIEVLEQVLLLSSYLHTQNYNNGFRYLNQHEVPEGQLPGIWKFEVSPETKVVPLIHFITLIKLVFNIIK